MRELCHGNVFFDTWWMCDAVQPSTNLGGVWIAIVLGETFKWLTLSLLFVTADMSETSVIYIEPAPCPHSLLRRLIESHLKRSEAPAV